jgi:starch synthase
MLPGYRGVLSQLQSLDIVGGCPVLRDACSSGRTATYDGLQIYVAICPELYDRGGTPYADEVGRDWRDNELRSERLSSAQRFWRQAKSIRTGARTSCMPTTGLPQWRRLTSAGQAAGPVTIHNMAHQGLFPREMLRRIGAPDAASTIDGVELCNQVSFLKSGPVCRSPRHCQHDLCT